MTIHDRAEPLRRVYCRRVCGAAYEQPAIEPVSRADAVVALMVASFQIGMDEPQARLRDALAMLSTLAAGVRCCASRSQPTSASFPPW